MNTERIANRLVQSFWAERVSQTILGYAGSGFSVSDHPEIEDALKREGFKFKRGYWQKMYNHDPEQRPDFDEIWRAEIGHDGKLYFRSRWKDRPRWSGALRKDMWPQSLKKFASRGNQVRRKDKDLMQDTGGISKGRDREPNFKPPRDDVKERYRDRRLKPEQQDRDTNENKDRPVKKPCRRPQVRNSSEIHPLDRVQEGAWAGLEVPENNYHRQVFRALWHIIEGEKNVGEKDFAGQDWIRDECDRIVRSPKAERIINRFSSGGYRPAYCAECIFASIG